jgi:hypothetical protein
LARHRWSEDQLKEFQKSFSKFDLLADYQQTVKTDLAFTCGWIESIDSDPLSFFIADTGSDSRSVILGALPRGWFYQNELSAARFSREILLPDAAPSADRVYPGASRTNALLFDQIPETPFRFVFKHLTIVFSPQSFAHVQTDVNLAQVACALERFRMAQGRFPGSLNALAPDFIAKLPHDIINGEPLKYRLSGDGHFVLYSVGWNEQDDGGSFPGIEKRQAAFHWKDEFHYRAETGDWVFAYPN